MVLPPKTPIRKPTSLLPFSSNTPVAFKIKSNRLQNTNNKNIDWCSPEIRESIFVLGTITIPTAKYSDRIISRCKAENNRKTEPEYVIISVGTSDKHNKPYATTFLILCKLLVKAKFVFQNSKIYMPQITYSDQLHPQECSNLQTMNRFIA